MPQLAPGWERLGLRLSPAEGFLLSRIDGSTPWTLLREIGGLAPGEADRCLERWVAEGLVIVSGGDRPRPVSEASGPPAGNPAEGEVDPGLEIPVDAQRRVLLFEAGLERPYHELLGVGAGVDSKTIKRAYFQLSKEYHPDRYYRREIGPYAEKLDRIFKKIVEAYELLMDPTTRAELERSMAGRAQAPAPPAPDPGVAAPAAPAAASAAAPPPSAGRRALERLHRQFRIPDAILAERRARAREFHAAALVAAHKQRWLEAAGSARLAIAFDPWSDEYKKRFGELQMKVNEMRAVELVERADAAAHAGSLPEALRLFEEALHNRPHDPVLNARAADLALDTGDLSRAREYAERACELRSDVGAYQRTLGRVLAKEGLRDKAIAAFERALAIDPKDVKAAEDIKRLRASMRRRFGGKR
ncbi:MAG TPA: DnaJ domain-containing protein [Myxococcota bacterium]